MKAKKKVITFADAQFWDMKILGDDAIGLLGGYIPLWICTHDHEEVRNYRKTLCIQSIVENSWWGGGDPHIPGSAPVSHTSLLNLTILHIASVARSCNFLNNTLLSCCYRLVMGVFCDK